MVAPPRNIQIALPMSVVLIDLYCERTAPGFWNEPVNALSNAAFVVVAALAWREANKRSHSDIGEKLVIILAGLIGAGSFLFHTFANSLTELADVIPIWGFVTAYTVLTIYRFTGQDFRRTARIAVITGAVILAINVFTSDGITTDGVSSDMMLNGSLQYAPALAALVIFTLLSHLRKHPVRMGLTLATAIFCAALFFRTIDLAACSVTAGIGTHFLWHLLNAAMIGVLLHTLIMHMPPKLPAH